MSSVGLGSIQTDSETVVRETLLTLVGLKGGASYTELSKDCGLPVSTFKYTLKSLGRRIGGWPLDGWSSRFARPPTVTRGSASPL
jgi:hypothetical protein